MLLRFFAPDLDPALGEVTLPDDETHHLIRVVRVQSGQNVAVFDGRGNEFIARVTSLDRSGVRLALIERVPIRQPRVQVTLVQSILKGDGMEDVVRDCTMVGVERLQPVTSAHTIGKGPSSSLLRWRRVAISSAKQSGRARLPDIPEPMPFPSWLSAAPVLPAFILLEPAAGVPGIVTVRALAHEPVPERATLVVGPEGGWTTEERDSALAAGCRPLSLGPLTLRAAAVPLAACAALLAVWDG